MNAELVADQVKKQHPVFKTLDVEDGGNTWEYVFTASEKQSVKGKTAKSDEAADKPTQGSATPNALIRTLGAAIDAVVPNDGMSKTLKVSGEIIWPAATLQIEFSGEAERDGKVRVRFNVETGLKTGANLWLFEAWAKASILGFMEAVGDNGAECIQFLLYAIYRATAAVNKKAADTIFGRDFAKNTKAMMTRAHGKEDYVKSGVGVKISGELGTKNRKSEAKTEAALSGTLAKEFSRHGTSDIRMLTLMTKFSGLGLVDGEAQLNVERRDEKWQGGLKISVEKKAQLQAFEDLAKGSEGAKGLLVNWVTNVASLISGAVRENLALSKSDSDVKLQIMSGLTLVESGTFPIGHYATSAALKKLKTLDASKLAGTAKILLTIKWDITESGIDMGISLDRATEIDTKSPILRVIYINMSNIAKIQKKRLISWPVQK